MTKADIQQQADQLINQARAAGLVLTIELQPQHPLAMGNYKMVASVRPIENRRRSTERRVIYSPPPIVEGRSVLRRKYDMPTVAHKIYRDDRRKRGDRRTGFSFKLAGGRRLSNRRMTPPVFGVLR